MSKHVIDAPSAPAVSGGKTIQEVLLLAADPLVECALTVLLEQAADLRLHRADGDIQAFERLIGGVSPAVAIIDADGFADSAAFIEGLLDRRPGLKLLVISSESEPGFRLRLARAGVRGFVRKRAVRERILQATRTVAGGYLQHDEGTLQRIMLEFPSLARKSVPQATPFDTLTATQRDVLRLLASGLRNQDIAQNLQMSLSTVKFHTSNIIRKLQVSSRTEAAVLAMREGFLGENGDAPPALHR